MSAAADDQRKVEWANGVLASHLDELGRVFSPGMPKRTVIVRNPDEPGQYMILTNEDDATANALHALFSEEGVGDAE